METTQTNLPAATVRANVNERAFFKSMRHLFASSFSVMGEMVQNARRAQATKIAITCDSATRVITISDNGMGIDKFDVLLDLATSGWESTETQLSERPFGMGFFSSCYAADRVVVMSKGKRLDITQDDVIEQRALHVVAMTSDQQASMGEWVTRIELHGVIADLLPKVEQGRPAIEVFRNKLGELVKGFPLPISFNGVDLPRECSQEALQGIGVQTSVGFVAIRSPLIGDAIQNSLQQPALSNMRLYLQGLPIEERDRYRPAGGEYVVHLDSSLFIAQMPDRTHLFDSEKQLPVIQKALTELVCNRLVQKKASSAPEVFVRECWDVARTFNMRQLFNDVPFIPCSLVSRVGAVAQSTGYQDVLESMHIVIAGEEKLFSYEELKSGELNVWRDAPGCTSDGPWAATALKVMQDAEIKTIAMNRLPEGHWVNDICPHYEDLEFKVDVEGAGQNEVDYCWNSSTATIREAKAVTVTVTSTVDPEFRLEHRIESDWLMVPVEETQEEEDDATFCIHDQNYICWIMETDGSWTHPVNVLATFTDDCDRYVEEWETDAKNSWDNKLAVLRNHHLSSTVNRILGRDYPQFSDANLGQIALVRLHKHGAAGAADPLKYSVARTDALAVDEDMLRRICEQLQSISGVAVSAEQLEQALWHAVRPGELVGGELAGSFHHNATLVKAKAD
jgi:hypothetical protein